MPPATVAKVRSIIQTYHLNKIVYNAGNEIRVSPYVYERVLFVAHYALALYNFKQNGTWAQLQSQTIQP